MTVRIGGIGNARLDLHLFLGERRTEVVLHLHEQDALQRRRQEYQRCRGRLQERVHLQFCTKAMSTLYLSFKGGLKTRSLILKMSFGSPVHFLSGPNS